MFIYQAKESSLVPAGFLTAHFLQELKVYEAFVVMGKLGCIAFMMERESLDKSILHLFKLLYTFPFVQASKAEEPHPSFPITTKAS